MFADDSLFVLASYWSSFPTLQILTLVGHHSKVLVLEWVRKKHRSLTIGEFLQSRPVRAHYSRPTVWVSLINMSFPLHVCDQWKYFIHAHTYTHLSAHCLHIHSPHTCRGTNYCDTFKKKFSLIKDRGEHRTATIIQMTYFLYDDISRGL